MWAEVGDGSRDARERELFRRSMVKPTLDV
jgi:hypothetical protein